MNHKSFLECFFDYITGCSYSDSAKADFPRVFIYYRVFSKSDFPRLLILQGVHKLHGVHILQGVHIQIQQKQIFQRKDRRPSVVHVGSNLYWRVIHY